jgi:hypothetical protein
MSPSSRVVNRARVATQHLAVSGLSASSGSVRSCRQTVAATTACVHTCSARSAVARPSGAPAQDSLEEAAVATGVV